ncbi:MAG: heavy-metal-associated domain-containing protein [Frankia sp.]
MERVYRVLGMTCEHCVRAVSSEVGGISGVTAVTVDLPANTVTALGDRFTDDEIAAAIEEAGYQLVATEPS